MYVTMPPKFERDMTPDRREGLRKSLCEVADMDFRTIHCPFCKTYLFDVFADFIGHIAVKCQACKGVVPINPAYFRRYKGKRYYIQRRTIISSKNN